MQTRNAQVTAPKTAQGESPLSSSQKPAPLPLNDDALRQVSGGAPNNNW